MPLPWRDDRNERRRENRSHVPAHTSAPVPKPPFGPAQERLYPSMYSSQYDVKVGKIDMSLPAAFANYVLREFRNSPDCEDEFLPKTSEWLAKVGAK